MRRVYFDDDEYDWFDVNRIVSTCRKNGIIISPSDARLAWQKYSDTMSAGWMNFPETDDEIINIISPYLKDADDH